jgi:hypothetical protein
MKFRQFDDYESSTRVCPCGARFTWSGADPALDRWMADHEPHAGPAVDSTVTADGQRAYAAGNSHGNSSESPATDPTRNTR